MLHYLTREKTRDRKALLNDNCRNVLEEQNIVNLNHEHGRSRYVVQQSSVFGKEFVKNERALRCQRNAKFLGTKK